MFGKIIKGVAGSYNVVTGEGTVYLCKARGLFRKNGITPLVGDNTEFEVTDEKDGEGNIIRILEWCRNFCNECSSITATIHI